MKEKPGADALKINEVDGDCIDGDDTTEGAVPLLAQMVRFMLHGPGLQDWFSTGRLDQGETWLDEDIFVADIPGGWDYHIPGIYRCNGLPITVCDFSGGESRHNLYQLV